MKSFLISHNEDAIIGLMLAGIEGVLAKYKEETHKYFEEAVEDPEIGIIIITEKILEEIE